MSSINWRHAEVSSYYFEDSVIVCRVHVTNDHMSQNILNYVSLCCKMSRDIWKASRSSDRMHTYEKVLQNVSWLLENAHINRLQPHLLGPKQTAKVFPTLSTFADFIAVCFQITQRTFTGFVAISVFASESLTLISNRRKVFLGVVTIDISVNQTQCVYDFGEISGDNRHCTRGLHVIVTWHVATLYRRVVFHQNTLRCFGRGKLRHACHATLANERRGICRGYCCSVETVARTFV